MPRGQNPRCRLNLDGSLYGAARCRYSIPGFVNRVQRKKVGLAFANERTDDVASASVGHSIQCRRGGLPANARYTRLSSLQIHHPIVGNVQNVRCETGQSPRLCTRRRDNNFDFTHLERGSEALRSHLPLLILECCMSRNMNPTGFDDIDGLTSEFAAGLSGAFAKILGDCSPHLEKHANRRRHVSKKADEAGRLRDRARHAAQVRQPRDD